MSTQLTTQPTNLFVIAHRHNQSLRLNHDIYYSLGSAKAELDRWEREEDPRRELYERSEEMVIRMNRRSWAPKSKTHNKRDFEVVDLATHLQNVAVQNYEKAKRERNYQGAHNTTRSHIERLALLSKAS